MSLPPLLARPLSGRPGPPTIPVRFSRRALEALCAHAREGLHEPYKREVIGILLGRAARDPRRGLACLRAVPYRTWLRWRTAVDPHPEALARKARALARDAGLRFLGCYHSHPEEAGRRSWGLSEEDRDRLDEDPDALVEVVVSVAEAGRRARAEASLARAVPSRNRDGTLTLWAEGHHFRLGAEVKTATPPRARAPRPR